MIPVNVDNQYIVGHQAYIHMSNKIFNSSKLKHFLLNIELKIHHKLCYFLFNAVVKKLFNWKSHRYKKEQKSFVIVVPFAIDVNLLKVS